MFPHGTNQKAGEIRISLHKTVKAAAAGHTPANFPNGLFRTVDGELWRTAHSIDTAKFFAAKYVRVLFVKLHAGKTLADLIDIYKQAGSDFQPHAGALFFARMYPRNAGEFDVAIIYGVDDLERLPGPAGPGTAPAVVLMNERLTAARDIVRNELWGRRVDFVAPKP